MKMDLAIHTCFVKYIALTLLFGLGTAACASGGLSHRSLLYCTGINGMFSLLFLSKKGMSLVGKREGRIPLWSYCVFWPFHVPTSIYTRLHKDHSVKAGIPVATEVVEGWWIGSKYGHDLKEMAGRWAGVVDLTAEFNETIECANYLNIPCWDGVPPLPEELEQAATFAIECKLKGDVMVHCAHGRGRSTCVMVACLVKNGDFDHWLEAFEACKLKRRCIGLNTMMRRALNAWYSKYQK
jgi:hypothetical protein